MKASEHKGSLRNLKKATRLIKKSIQHESAGIAEMKRKRKKK